MLKTIKPEQFQSDLEKYGDVVKSTTDNSGNIVTKPAICSHSNAQVLMASKEAQGLLPTLSHVSAHPVLVDNDKEVKLLGPGYHPECGGIYIQGGNIENMPDVQEGVDYINTLHQDFIFETTSDGSRAIAAMLTLTLKRGGFLGDYHIPLNLIEARESQTGKGYLVDLNAAVYGEIPYLFAEQKRGVGSVDESLAQAMVQGNPIIVLDNFRGKINSPLFEMCLTAPGEIPARIPHVGTVMVNPHNHIFYLTSNGTEITKDLGNRSSITRLRKKDGAFRQYSEGDLLDHVRANQWRYLSSVYSVVKHWAEQGRPKTGDLRGAGRMRHWWQSCDWIIQNIFKMPSMLDDHQEAQSRASNPALTWLRLIAIKVHEMDLLTQPHSASALCEVSEENDIEIPGHKGHPKQGAITVGRNMGRIFANGVTTFQVDGYTVEKVISKHTYDYGDSGTTKNISKYIFRLEVQS